MRRCVLRIWSLVEPHGCLVFLSCPHVAHRYCSPLNPRFRPSCVRSPFHPLSLVKEGIRRSSSPHVGRRVARTRVCSSTRSHRLSSTSARPRRLSSLSALAPASRTLSTRLTLQDPSTSVIYARVSAIHLHADLDWLCFQLRAFARLPAVSALLISPDPPFYSAPTVTTTRSWARFKAPAKRAFKTV